MKDRSRFLLLFLQLFLSLVLSIDRAFAMSEPSVLRATPYPTLTPITSTPTMVPLSGLVDFSCPVGVPAGYGTVTPSTEWLIACGQCLPTNTVSPDSYTSTVGPTRTPIFVTSVPSICMTATGPGTPEVCYTATAPSFTPSPTFTPSPSPSPSPTATLSSAAVTFVDYDVNVNGWAIPYDYADVSCYQYGDGVRCDYDFEKYGTAGGHMAADFTVNMLVPNTGNIYSYMVGDTTGAFWYNHPIFGINVDVGNVGGGQVGSTGSEPATATGAFSEEFIVPSTGNTSYATVGVSGASFQGASSLVGSLYIFAHPFDPDVTPTPGVTFTPSPTPIGENFCDSVSSGTVPNQFNLGGTGSIVYQTCGSTPEISFEAVIDAVTPFWLEALTDVIFEIFPSEVIIDPLTVCVRTRDYSLYIFGYRMPIEFIIGLGVFLAGMRFWTPTVFSGVSVMGKTGGGGSDSGTGGGNPYDGNDTTTGHGGYR